MNNIGIIVAVLIFCVAMFFPIIGYWTQYGKDASYAYPIYYSLWDITYVISENPTKTQSWAYDSNNPKPTALPEIITCVITGYTLLVISLLMLFINPTSLVFTVPLITGGVLSCVSYLLWVKTIPSHGTTMPSLYTELLGGIVIIIFGLFCNFYK